jgi:MFS family permease
MTAIYRDPPGSTVAAGSARTRTKFSSILALENLPLLMAVIFGIQIVDRSFGPVLALHLAQMGYSSTEIPVRSGILFSVLAVSAAFGNQLSSRLLARVHARIVITRTALAAAAGLAVFSFSRDMWLLGVAIAMFGACAGSALTAAYTAAGSVIPRDVHATGFGFLTGASLTGVALSPVLSGLVGSASIPAVFGLGVVVLVGLAALVARVMVPQPGPVEAAVAGRFPPEPE